MVIPSDHLEGAFSLRYGNGLQPAVLMATGGLPLGGYRLSHGRGEGATSVWWPNVDLFEGQFVNY